MMNQSELVGYVRLGHLARDTVKVSINVDAFKNCRTYTTSDGQTYVALEINRSNLNKVFQGERVVTTICQNNE